MGYAQNSSWELNGNAISGVSNFLGTTNYMPLIFKTNSTERMRLTNDGNIGINTAQPQEKLHIHDGNILISRSSQNTSSSILFGDSIGLPFTPFSKYGIEYENTNNGGYGLNFWMPMPPDYKAPNAHLVKQTILFLDMNGRVGIGTKTPQAKLDVRGNVNISGMLSSPLGIGISNPQACLHVQEMWLRKNLRRYF